MIDKSVPQIVYSAKPMLRMGSFHEIAFSELSHCFNVRASFLQAMQLVNTYIAHSYFTNEILQPVIGYTFRHMLK